MDSSGWLDVEDEDDPLQIMTITDVVNRRLLAQEKARGNIEQRGENLDGFGCLPDVVIEQIFGLLSIRDRYYASLVCKQWNRAFYTQYTWNTLELDDNTLTRRKFNYYSGWNYRLDHLRTQYCISHIGKHIRSLILRPVWALMNIFEFMSLLSYYAERNQQDGVTPCLLKVHAFRFVFYCNMASRQEQLVYGTGGEMLESLKRLMGNLKHLRYLELIDLLLDPCDAAHLLDEVCICLTDKLLSLTLINATKSHYNLLHPGVFVNLRILKISPQNLCNEVVELLSGSESLQKMYIIQNAYTEFSIPVDSRSWRMVGRKFPVLLRVMGDKLDREVVHQEGAPVTSIIYDCPVSRVSWSSILTTIEYYSHTLNEYGHLGLPKFQGSRKFGDRVDGPLLTLCRKCPYINTLIVRERISTSTAMLIASMSPNLKYFYVRSNALVKKCDFPFHNLDFDQNFTMWLKSNCRSYEKITAEIAKILGYEWTPLTDNQFKFLSKQKIVY